MLVLSACTSAPPPAPTATPVPDALAAIQARGTFRVGADVNSPPMCSRRPDGVLDGFEVRIAEGIASALGVRLEFVPVNWNSHVLAVQQGSVDAVIAGWIPHDDAPVAFSVPYLASGLALVVPADSNVRSLGDLGGKRVGIYDDPPIKAWAAGRLPESTVRPFADGYFQLLAEGELDAFAYDWAFVLGELTPYLDRAQVVSLNVFPMSYGALLPPDQPGLSAAVDQAISSMRSSAEYRQWLDRYFDPAPIASALNLPPPAADARRHTVAPGETLKSLSARYYGTEDRWMELWRANRDRVAFPERPTVGQTLVIR